MRDDTVDARISALETSITLADVKANGSDVVELVGHVETVPPAQPPYR